MNYRGDNAVLIGMAALLMHIPALRFISGASLVWIAFKLLNEEVGEEGSHKAAESLWQAMWIIVVADIVMSLDNILGVAAVCHGDWGTMIAGLAMSMPLVLFGGGVVAMLMNRLLAQLRGRHRHRLDRRGDDAVGPVREALRARNHSRREGNPAAAGRGRACDHQPSHQASGGQGGSLAGARQLHHRPEGVIAHGEEIVDNSSRPSRSSFTQSSQGDGTVYLLVRAARL